MKEVVQNVIKNYFRIIATALTALFSFTSFFMASFLIYVYLYDIPRYTIIGEMPASIRGTIEFVRDIPYWTYKIKPVSLPMYRLYIDADESVSEQLRKEIEEAISHSREAGSRFAGQPSAISGYEIRRKNYYLGHPWPEDEYLLRLMRKDALIGWHGVLHESARVKGAIGRLDGPLIHTTHRTLEEMVAKTNLWSETEAILRYNRRHPPVVWWRLARVMITAFWDSFIRQQGWRAGVAGWIESIYQAFSMFITYAKLWELQQNSANKPII